MENTVTVFASPLILNGFLSCYIPPTNPPLHPSRRDITAVKIPVRSLHRCRHLFRNSVKAFTAISFLQAAQWVENAEVHVYQYQSYSTLKHVMISLCHQPTRIRNSSSSVGLRHKNIKANKFLEVKVCQCQHLQYYPIPVCDK